MTAPERWSRIETLYHAARDRNASERAAFLDAACGDDAALRREVESLLAQPASDDGFLGTPAVAAVAQMTDFGRSVLSGRRIGVYEIQMPLGAGGMGEVYRARDTRLGRDVAIKILPRAFAAEPDRLARFEREARVLAALNHPNIATIYSVEESHAVHAIVMELVEGETLREKLTGLLPAPGSQPAVATDVRSAESGARIRRGEVMLSEALAIARQIAEALDAAHERGIIHRDLKPANVKITPDGTVKVLDFGLAKLDGAGLAGDAGTNALTSAGTHEGVVLGTVGYMSPEQARGRPVDKRTDVWSFGCVLYEMLSGRMAFGADTLSDAIAAILNREPDWDALPPSVPPGVRRRLRHCLAKDCKRRMRDIGDARLEIEDLLASLSSKGALPGRVEIGRDIEFQRLTDFLGNKESPAISPDGKMVAFVAVMAGKRQIWLRLLAGGAGIQITREPVDHEHPRWAPDSSTLIYYTPTATSGAEGTVWEINALGGLPRRVASAIGGGDVSHDGRYVAVLQPAGEQVALVVLARDGSRADRIALLPGGYVYLSPRWSPDDRAIAFQRASGTGWDMTLQVVTIGVTGAREVTRQPWLRGFSWFPDGSGFVYSSSRGSTLRYPPTCNLRRVDRDGQNDRQLTVGDQSYLTPDAQLSKTVAARVRSRSDIWKFPTTGSALENTRAGVRVTRQSGQAQVPSASPDDTEVVYLSDNGGHANLWVATISGSDARQITRETDPDVVVAVPTWSPAGGLIAFVMSKDGTAAVWVVHPDGSGLRLLAPRAWEPCWSGDGRWLYYRSLVDGRERIEKIPTEGGSPIVVRDEREAASPAISADGSTLYYVARPRLQLFGYWRADHEIRRAMPEGGASHPLVPIAANRIPTVSVVNVRLSPDARLLALPLVDGGTTNVWVLPTSGEPMRQVTDFGDRSIAITRSVAWASDSRAIYAAVSEVETDIVLLDGLI